MGLRADPMLLEEMPEILLAHSSRYKENSYRLAKSAYLRAAGAAASIGSEAAAATAAAAANISNIIKSVFGSVSAIWSYRAQNELMAF